MAVSIRNLLEQHPVEASAPCRIDSGGTWDIKAMALPFPEHKPTTVNIAIDLRTTVTLMPYDQGCVRIASKDYFEEEAYRLEEVPFNSPLGLFFTAITYFGFHGVSVSIHAQSPIKSALGGSSTALVALLSALNTISSMLGLKKCSKEELLYLGYHLEDAVSGGNCGLQDQAAAVFGGVNQWVWIHGHPGMPFERTILLDREGEKDLSAHLLLAYSGSRHESTNTNRRWIKDFLSGKTRKGWIETNRVVHSLARAIKERQWGRAADLLKQELHLRKAFTPEALIPVTSLLIQQAEQAVCGARFSGAGAGGCVWALGGTSGIETLKEMWEKTLNKVDGAKVLSCSVDPKGVESVIHPEVS